MRDTFSDCHPAVNFLYFALVLAFSMCLMHPACLVISLTGACCYLTGLYGLRELGRSARWLIPMALLAAVVNPAFVHQGVTILTYLPSGNPLTLESILYGLAAALLLGGMLAAWLLACALPDEDTLADRFGSRTQGSAMRAALVTGAALLLHNLPEGILTLLTNVSDPQLGARTALAIALHNIPEGLAVAVPFACATGSRAKGAVAALVSGLAEPAGAVLAALVLAPLLTPGLLNGIVAVVAGIMLWVAAAQLLPAAFEPAWRKMGVTGFCTGVLMMILGIAALA